jgi:GAF domain-containing protein
MNSGEMFEKAAAALTVPVTGTVWQDLVSSLGHALNVDWTLLVELPPGGESAAHTLAAWHQGKIVSNFEYPFERLPEDDAMSLETCLYPSAAQTYLPNSWLKEVKAEAFGRASLFDSLGRLRGILVIAHSQPRQDADRIEAVLRVFAFKAATELERALADEQLYRELLGDTRKSRPR